jgi:hypothetical protein
MKKATKTSSAAQMDEYVHVWLGGFGLFGDWAPIEMNKKLFLVKISHSSKTGDASAEIVEQLDARKMSQWIKKYGSDAGGSLKHIKHILDDRNPFASMNKRVQIAMAGTTAITALGTRESRTVGNLESETNKPVARRPRKVASAK